MDTIMEYILFPFSGKNFVYILLVYAIIVGLSFALISVLVYFKKLSLYDYIKTEEIVFSIVSGVFCFCVFYLHYALLLWSIVYLLFGLFEKKNRSIRYLYNLSISRQTMLSRKEMSAFNQICKRISFREEKGFLLIRDLKTMKSKISLVMLTTPFADRKIWKQSFFSPKAYFVGLAVPLFNYIFVGSQYSQSDCSGLILIEEIVLLFAILSIIYPLLWRLTVDNEVHRLFGCKKTFNILYVLLSGIVLFIFIGISFSS